MSNHPDLDSSLLIEPDGSEGPIDFYALFGRPGPVHMEIGSGKGTFLVSQAAACPEINYLGIEWANKYCRYAADRLARRGLRNVRLIRTDAAAWIAGRVPRDSVEMVHIYFPDPWPKKRHHKRRFFCQRNLEILFERLVCGGIINAATDHADYFDQMQATADWAEKTGRAERIDFIRPAGAAEGETVGTNYERKYQKEGRLTHTLTLRKR